MCLSIIVSQLEQRIQIQGIRKDPWFRINYVPIRAREEEEVNLDDVRAVFDGIEVCGSSSLYRALCWSTPFKC